MSEAARAAELYELADEVSALTIEAFALDGDRRVAAELQRAELLLEYELALLAAAEQPGESTAALLTAVRAHANHLWRLRSACCWST